MKAEFWHARWQNNQIPFHQTRENQHLEPYWPRLGVDAGCVFVPLCGKSLDILWFVKHGFSVLGIELSPIAVRDFFVDNELPYTTTDAGEFQRWQSADVEILLGDYFDLRPAHLPRITAVFDRAALIAMPPAARGRYVEQLAAIVPRRTPILLISFEYDETEMDGPPFSVTEAEIHRLYASRYRIEKLWSREVLENAPRFKDRGLTWVVESVYRLQPVIDDVDHVHPVDHYG